MPEHLGDAARQQIPVERGHHRERHIPEAAADEPRLVDGQRAILLLVVASRVYSTVLHGIKLTTLPLRRQATRTCRF